MKAIKVKIKKVHKIDRELFPEGAETFIHKSILTGKWLIKSPVNKESYNLTCLTSRISNRCSFGDILTKIN